MKRKPRIQRAWAVEWRHDGKREIYQSYSAYRTRRQAQRAFEQHQGIPWVKAAEAGAKLVKRTWMVLPDDRAQ